MTPDSTEWLIAEIRAIGREAFQREFLQSWPQPTMQERMADNLAERYHRETEAYDQTVCTGPIIRGEIMPNSGHEMALSNRNAIKVHRLIIAEAAQHGISPQEMQRAVSRCARWRHSG